MHRKLSKAVQFLNPEELKKFDFLYAKFQKPDPQAMFDAALVLMDKSLRLPRINRRRMYSGAAFLLDKASALDHPQALHGLGRLYLYGLGVRPCATLGLRLCLTASKLGNERANETITLAAECVLNILPWETQKCARLYVH